MPYIELGAEEDYMLAGKVSKLAVANRFVVRAILNDEMGKYFLIVGAYDDADQKHIGEIIAVVRTQDVTNTYYQVYTLDTLMRSGKDSSANIAARKNELEAMRFDNLLGITLLSSYWQSIKQSPHAFEFICRMLGAHATRLLAAQTRDRLSAGARYAQVADLKDSLGRVNPGASATRLLTASRYLSGQLEFDELSYQSAEYRQRLGLKLARLSDDTLDQVYHLLHSNLSAQGMQRELRKHLARLPVKPYIFALETVLESGDMYRLGVAECRERILSALFTERLLIELSAALSLLRYSYTLPEHREKAVVEMLGLLDYEPPYPIYSDLFDLLHGQIASLCDPDVSDGHVVKAVKKLVRYRQQETLAWPTTRLLRPVRK